LDNWNKIEFIFSFKLHIPPSELERLEFYRIQFLITEYEEHIDRENKEYDKQRRDSDKQSKLPSSSDYGNFKTPKFEVPKFETPKF